MIFLTLTLLIVVILLLIILYHQLKKVSNYEKIVQEQVQYLQNISLTIQKSQQYLKSLDEKETFKSDDEIGYFFEQLLQVQQELDKYILPTDYGK